MIAGLVQFIYFGMFFSAGAYYNVCAEFCCTLILLSVLDVDYLLQITMNFRAIDVCICKMLQCHMHGVYVCGLEFPVITCCQCAWLGLFSVFVACLHFISAAPCLPNIVSYYPHMPIGKVWIYCLLFVCLFVCLYGYGFLRRG